MQRVNKTGGSFKCGQSSPCF